MLKDPRWPDENISDSFVAEAVQLAERTANPHLLTELGFKEILRQLGAERLNPTLAMQIGSILGIKAERCLAPRGFGGQPSVQWSFIKALSEILASPEAEVAKYGN
jgi:hypothetical protein